MPGDRRLLLGAVVLALGASGAVQGPADGRLLAGRAVRPTVAIKAWNAAGSIRFVGWSKDSVVVRGEVGRNVRFLLSQDGDAMKLIAEQERDGSGASPSASHLVAWVPRQSALSVKTVSADITADGVGGWFYSVSGNLRVTGSARSIEAESMTGNLDLDVACLWVRARAGSGRLDLRGATEAADLSTISGDLRVATSSLLRAQIASVTGDIRFAATPTAAGIVDVSDHSGSVEVVLPDNASAELALTSIAGSIENGVTGSSAMAPPSRSLNLRLGRGESRFIVRTFTGPIRLKMQPTNAGWPELR
jgi:putative adhesin